MRFLCAIAAIAAPLLSQAPDASAFDPTGKLHPYLCEQLQAIPAATRDRAKLPVYFVIRERFDFAGRYPEFLRMPLVERRARAIRELEAHAARTQRRLLAELRVAEAAGEVSDISINWLGNFVKCSATATAIVEAAVLPSVREVWFDYVPPLADVEDRVPAAAAAPTALPAGPGNGPLAVGADKVWAMGIRGKGVVVLNSDSGISMDASSRVVAHNALKGNVWHNPGETFNGRDDDGNGKVDDVYGWSFARRNNRIGDGGGHGTETAGCMVADASCNGTTYGIAPQAKLMVGKLSGESSQWDAIQYGIKEGADTQTSSHSYKIYFRPAPNYAMHRDVANASLLAGLIRTNSTSNDGRSCNSSTRRQRRPFNISAPGNLPPPYIDPNQRLVGGRSGVIGVGAYFVSSNALASYSPCGPFAWSLAELKQRVSYPHSWKSSYNDYPTAGGKMGLLKPDVVAPTGTRTSARTGCSIVTFGGTSNATPNAMGCILLWKSANKSLKPEDVGMIIHQTSHDRGSVRGKENRWGAGTIDAFAGVKRALCVHRVDGDPAWTVKHKAGTRIDIALDGSEQKLGLILVGGSRKTTNLGFVSFGLGQPVLFLTAGSTGPAGEAVRARFVVPSGAIGITFYSQAFVDDRSGPTKLWLSSNVIGTTITP